MLAGWNGVGMLALQQADGVEAENMGKSARPCRGLEALPQTPRRKPKFAM